jgi:hypothetical protein
VTRRKWLIAAAAFLRAQNSLDTVGAARDLVYQALEQLSVSAPEKNVRSAISLLRAALYQYPSFGDAYYYRQLCLKHLGVDETRQRLDLAAARRYDSEALRDERDPFKLAVPRIYDNLGAVGQKWALIVGISKFNREKGASPLGFADADATAFAKLLRDPGVGRFPEKPSVPACERSSHYFRNQGPLEHDCPASETGGCRCRVHFNAWFVPLG